MSSRGQQTMYQAVPFRGNRFDRMQWAGAFGDLGTLIPFVVAYITLFKGTGEDQALGGNGRGRRTFSLKR